MDAELKTLVKDAVASKKRSLQRARAALHTIQNLPDWVLPFVALVLATLRQNLSDWEGKNNVWAGFETDDTKVVITFGVHNLSGFKAPELLSALQIAAAFTDEIEEQEYASVRNKDIVYRMPDATVRFACYVKSDSETCKRVEVGRKVEERILYKMVCN